MSEHTYVTPLIFFVYYIVCPKNLHILRLPEYTKLSTQSRMKCKIYPLAQVPQCKFPIAAIDNVEKVAEKQFVYKKKKNALN